MQSPASKTIFAKQKLRRKKYYKSKIKNIYNDADFSDVEITGELPEDTSILFFILKKKTTRAIYFDSFGNGIDTYRLIFATMKDFHINPNFLAKVISIFDEYITNLQMQDEHNFKLSFCGETKTVSDKELIYMLSSGTTKGMLLYILMIASIQQGFDLIIDEIENHFHKTLVENMISLYKDKSVNKRNATLIFTTHYCELLDLSSIRWSALLNSSRVTCCTARPINPTGPQKAVTVPVSSAVETKMNVRERFMFIPIVRA